MNLKIIVLKILITLIKLVALVSFGWLIFRKTIDIINDFSILNSVFYLIQVIVVVLAFFYLMVFLEYWFSFLGLPIKFKYCFDEIKRRYNVFEKKTTNL